MKFHQRQSHLLSGLRFGPRSETDLKLGKGLFKAMLKNAPTILSKADEDIQTAVLEKLVDNPASRWSCETSLTRPIYHSWLHHLNNQLSGCYGYFLDATHQFDRILPNSVQTTKSLKIFGKAYNTKELYGGVNSWVEFCVAGEYKYGQIVYHFCSSHIPSTFICVAPFVNLDVQDSAQSTVYHDHPRLHGALVYDKTGPIVVVDSRDLMGHIVLLQNPAGTYGIRDATISLVSLRNIVSLMLYSC